MATSILYYHYAPPFILTLDYPVFMDMECIAYRNLRTVLIYFSLHPNYNNYLLPSYIQLFSIPLIAFELEFCQSTACNLITNVLDSFDVARYHCNMTSIQTSLLGYI